MKIVHLVGFVLAFYLCSVVKLLNVTEESSEAKLIFDFDAIIL